ncbi:1-deoxy-D-xylulose-5-phosphate synthase [Candidatus Poribacteria bacterium]|nr:MAG: 1-deoxy-D-xylulose-5-phosphate synthase [Candidatus Poribacteria bacterium]
MVLEKINNPSDLKNLNVSELKTLAEEMRAHLLSVLSEHPGHFAPNFGTVELAIAVHTVFDTPRDKVIWDIGHQAYPHKLLTGRLDTFETLRQTDGISGFLSRDESKYDVFGAGHSSTSISAALGIAAARDVNNDDFKVIAIIGDGGLTGGMALEGLNAAGDFKKDMLVILNDNQMSISPTIGAISKHFHKLISSRGYNRLRSGAKELINFFPSDAKALAQKIEASLKPGTLFEEFGFRYFGPLDGNDLESLIPILTGIRELTGPILVHVVTKKGKGYPPAEEDPVGFYSVSGQFDLKTGKSLRPASATPKYTDVFSRTLIEMAKKDSRIIGVTAAMPGGTGLDKFSEAYPERCFDVGLAEQCAVTFAAGLATEGLKPVVAIYSTFLQRGYDQVLHDVCIQNLPVVFALDRAGLVGADGPTHHGVFDIAYLRSIPNIVSMAPKDENELQHMLKTALTYEMGPIALRYPRGTGTGVKLETEAKPLPIGKAEICHEGEDLLIVALGNRVYPALEAAQTLSKTGIETTVVNARFIKPLDTTLIVDLAKQIGKIITVEDGVLMGGFGSAVLEALAAEAITDVRVTSLGVPDRFIEHGDVKTLYDRYGYDTEAIIRAGVALAVGV